jgi:uncharacterized protein YndB with AHSA1/START domain
MQRVLVEHAFSAPRERVFDHLAEHEHLQSLFGLRVERIRDGTDGHRNGVGSARRLSFAGRLPFTETVTAFEPSERIEYRITQGSPLRGHRGEMRFTDRPDGGTDLRYEITFGAVVPGLDRVVKAGLDRNVRRGLAKLVL